jgi:hypothetical protein
LKQDPAAFELRGKVCEAVSVSDFVGRGFKEPRALFGVKFAFPADPVQIIAAKMRRRLPLFVEREMS